MSLMMKNMKSKKSWNLIVSQVLFLTALAIVSLPAIFLALGASTDNFSVTTTVGNNAPAISWVQAPSDGPNAGTTKTAQVMFNASDENGASTLNDSSAYINLTNGGTLRQSSNCTVTQINATSKNYVCNITIYYYDTPGSWNINAYIRDNSGNATNLSSSAFTMGNVDDVDVMEGSISFTGTPGQSDVGATENPVTVNNTGNQAYSQIALTAFNLISGGSQIGAGNFSANISNSADGQMLINNSAVAVAGSTLTRGASATRDVYVFLDVPIGVAGATYTSSSSWLIDPS
jgi:hypothetical protein